jgi:hypothetical protein
MKSPRVEILIDELVLHGFSAADRYAIGESLSLELQRLVAAGNPAELAALGDVSALRAANISLPADAKTQTVGAQVAAAVNGSLNAGTNNERAVK